MIRICILIASLFIFYSCGSKNDIPPGILKPQKMEIVLWDVIKADAYTEGFIKKDTTKNAVDENLKLQQQIFAIHKITKDEFYRSYEYYKLHTPLFKTILDSLTAKAERNKYVKEKPLISQ